MAGSVPNRCVDHRKMGGGAGGGRGGRKECGAGLGWSWVHGSAESGDRSGEVCSGLAAWPHGGCAAVGGSAAVGPAGDAVYAVRVLLQPL